MARLLITGGAGYVGSHCAKLLHAQHHECISLDNLTTGKRDFVRWGQLIEGDIRDPVMLDGIFRKYEFDAVVHFAGVSSVAESLAEPQKYQDINVDGTRTLLDAMARAGVKVMVFSSSCAIYGAPERMPIREDTRPNPLSPYGASKLACEGLLDEFVRNRDFKSARLRYFNAAGADPSAEIGEDHDRETRLIPLALDALTRRRQPLDVFGEDYPTPDGSAIRDYIHVCDLARGHGMALSHLLSGGDSLTLNLGTGRGTSVHEILRAIHSFAGQEVPVRRAARRPGDPAILVADPTAAKKVLGWSAECSDLKTIIGDAWRWHRNRFPD